MNGGALCLGKGSCINTNVHMAVLAIPFKELRLRQPQAGTAGLLGTAYLVARLAIQV